MRLCFTSHVRFYQSTNKITCTFGFAKLLEMIAPLYDHVDLCVPVFNQPAPDNSAEPVSLPNLTVCPLPPYNPSWEQSALLHPVLLIRSLWPYVKRNDVVFISLPNYISFLVWIVCLWQGKKFAIRMAGNWPELFRLGFRRRGIPLLGHIVAGGHDLLLRLMIRTSTITLAHGNALTQIYGRSNPRVVRIISSTTHEADIADHIATSQSQQCQLLYVGRLQPAKGLSELLLAVKDLISQGLSLRVVLAGNGPLRDNLQKQASDLSISNYVEFLGWITDSTKLQTLYRTSDVFVMPSHSETGPKVVSEAICYGLPVVATRVGSVPAVVQDGQTGFIVPPACVGSLRDALQKIIVDEQLRHNMAAAALQRSSNFTIEAERHCVSKAFRKFGLLT